MQARVSNVEFRQLARGVESDLDEVVAIIDGVDQLAGLGRSTTHAGFTWIGLDPGSDLSGGSRLKPRAEPTDVMLGRCDCGIPECGVLIARLSLDGQHVIWDRFRSGSTVRSEQRELDGGPFVFDRAQYEQALAADASPASNWKPHTRQAAMLVNAAVSGWRSEDMRLLFAGCQSKSDAEVLLRAFFGRDGDPDRAALHVVVSRAETESAEEMARRIIRYVQSGEILRDGRVHRRAIPQRRHTDRE